MYHDDYDGDYDTGKQYSNCILIPTRMIYNLYIYL